jgi:hypothetical protein
MKPPFLCELQSEVGEAGHFFVVMLLMRGYVVEWETQRVEKDDRLDDRLDDRRVPVLGRGKGTPARVADIARLDDLIGPRSRGSVVLPKCRGCRRQHRIKKPRLYLLARDVLRRGGDTVYVGD